MRFGLILTGLILAAAGAALGIAGFWPVSVWLIVVGAVLAIGAAIERGRYKPADEIPTGPDWRMTGELFIEDGVEIRVWHNQRTGARRYVRARTPSTSPP